MLPTLIRADKLNTGSGDAKLFSKLALEVLASGIKLAYLYNFVGSEFGQSMLLAAIVGSVFAPIQHVVTPCAPAEIFRPIIGLYVILMTRMLARRCRTNECFQDKAMDTVRYLDAICAKNNSQIAVTSTSWLQDSWNLSALLASISVPRADAAKARSFIQWMVRDHAPIFINHFRLCAT